MQTNQLFAAILATAVSGIAGTLSGTLLNPDSTGRAGVTITLASTGESIVTGADGSWSLATPGIDGILPRLATPQQVGSHMVLQGSRLRVSLDGRDLAGRQALSSALPATTPSLVAARSLEVAPDTLVYSRNGKTILRDTISAVSQAGILRTFDTTVNAKVTYGYVTDARDGHVYRTVKMGDKFWTAQNANFATDSSWCYAKTAANCNTYGRLYQWHAAMGVTSFFDVNAWGGDTTSQQGACPAGWHVPTYTEWKALLSVTTESRAGTLLKSTSLWSTSPGLDSLGFKIVASGYWVLPSAAFSQQGGYADFWSSTEMGDSDASYFYFYSTASSTYDIRDKRYGYALRCVGN